MKTPPTCVSIRKSELIKRGINSFQEWNKASNHLYIGRSMDKYITGAFASKWQNIYSSQKYGVEECLRLYEERVRNTPNLFNSISELEGLELGCWCKPNYCLGDVLIKLYSEYVEKKCKRNKE